MLQLKKLHATRVQSFRNRQNGIYIYITGKFFI